MTENESLPATESIEEWRERYEKLRAEHAFLQARAARFVAVEQDLISARHLVDLERGRFERMREFIRSGLRAETVSDCVRLVGDGIVDILECEIGIVWLKAPAGHEEVFHVSHSGQEDWDLGGNLRERLRQCMAASPAGELLDVVCRESLGFMDLMVREVVGDDACHAGLMVAANSHRAGRFHDRFTPCANEAFSAFASQVGAILGSLKKRDTIVAQVEQIRISEQLLAVALASSNVGLWDWDLASGLVHYSEQWKKMIGYSGDEILDRFDEWHNRLHPLDRDEAVKVASQSSKKIGAFYEQTFRLRHRNGSWRWILAKGFTISGSDGQPVRVVGTHIDVTRFKRLENRLRKSENSQRNAKENALRENSAKSTFLANVSHELRTPLNGILGVYEILKELPQTETGMELVKMGHQSAQWMLDIVGESLDLAKIEAGKIELKENTFDLVEMVSDLTDIKRRKAAEKGLTFGLHVADGLPRLVVGDAPKLRQILTNLIGNAIKFTDHGAVSVHVDAKGLRDEDVVNLRFRIRDSGIGIPKGSIEDIFQPFHQTDQSKTRRFGGVGLGLAIVRNLTDLMKGRVRVRSLGSLGSEFTVTLPFQIAKAFQQEVGDQSSKSISFRGKVLVAEDDEVSRSLAIRMLEKLGFEVVAAENGAIALELFEPGTFDLVVLDWWMPWVTGVDVCLKIRESERFTTERVPILAMTANVQSTATIECLRAGMDEFLGKPILFQSLADAVLRLVPHAQVAT